ncbi:IMP cyclohydrolase [Kitasatospora sp. NBC_01287]|uniref:IMP cyclohydrolase n=1 Tax=Kitasatospora sp. NBC_01287 TaxID=2903573 RepID=UPI00224E57E1|nr:IMP cyclohydrolase [Kitasatospora sp. NBC_01287]MCX4746038.1 IMP cyclohydrolase [Kitasatospora sp. NBC_01287]
MEHLTAALTANHYPGRGVLWARTLDGTLLGGYFLTGRSPASQARTLGVVERSGAVELIVAPTPAEQREHDHLRHYAAARESGGWLAFGNGEQVATVADRLAEGQAPGSALDGLDYEPDPPIFTPRLTVVARSGDPHGQAWFGAARHSAGPRGATDRLTLRVGELAPGEGVLLTTYRSPDGQAIATGAPFTEVAITAPDRIALLDQVWAALRPELRVAATVFAPGALAGAELRAQARG